MAKRELKKNNDEHKKSKKNQVSIRIINLIVFIFCLIVFVQAMFILSKWFINNKKSEKIISDLKEEVFIDISEDEENNKNPIDFDKLKAQNSDTVGWIQIDGTNIDYPIVRAEDNDYYLQRDFYKKWNSCGWIFMDFKNNEKFIDKNTVIYGHNLKSNYMFADLQKIYKNELDNNILIKVYTPTELLKYRIFSCYMEEPEDYALKSNLVSESETEKYIKEMIKRSKYQYNVVPDKNGKLLTLSTCDKTGENRILVHCVCIGGEEF